MVQGSISAIVLGIFLFAIPELADYPRVWAEIRSWLEPCRAVPHRGMEPRHLLVRDDHFPAGSELLAGDEGQSGLSRGRQLTPRGRSPFHKPSSQEGLF